MFQIRVSSDCNIAHELCVCVNRKSKNVVVNLTIVCLALQSWLIKVKVFLFYFKANLLQPFDSPKLQDNMCQIR